MKQRIIDFIKCNPNIFALYNRFGSIFIRLMGVFIPIKRNKILFVSFGGKKYDDSPQSIYEKMITMKEFEGYEFVWAFVNTKSDILGNAKIVKIDSVSYFYHALSSKFWVVNVSAERGLNFKRKKTICINSWHGTPLKKIYGEENANQTPKIMKKPERFDLVCAQSEYDQKIYSRIFNMKMDDIIISDLPRNDKLLKYTKDDIAFIKEKLEINQKKKVILYVPTYREYSRDSANACYFMPPLDFRKWESTLGNEYVLLFRAHYLVVKSMNIEENEFVREVSQYPQMSELYAISDIMISDYSSAFFDYAILERPELCFAYDLKEYEEKRGMYINIAEELPCTVDDNEDAILQHIANMDYKKASEMTRQFKAKYAPVAGCATEMVINEIIKRYINKR